MKLTILKQRIEAPARMLTVKWTYTPYDFEEERKKPETEEEEAEEIIHRLKTPPRKQRNNTFHGLDLEKELVESMSKSIMEKIDRELDIYGQGTDRTR